MVQNIWPRWRPLSAVKPDVVLTVWGKLATAMAHRLLYPVFAYYGNPDTKTAKRDALFKPDQ